MVPSPGRQLRPWPGALRAGQIDLDEVRHHPAVPRRRYLGGMWHHQDPGAGGLGGCHPGRRVLDRDAPTAVDPQQRRRVEVALRSRLPLRDLVPGDAGVGPDTEAFDDRIQHTSRCRRDDRGRDTGSIEGIEECLGSWPPAHRGRGHLGRAVAVGAQLLHGAVDEPALEFRLRLARQLIGAGDHA